VIDLATKMVTGWQLSSHMRTSLVTDALTMAISHGHLAPGAAVFHSDRGAVNTPPASSRGSARPVGAGLRQILRTRYACGVVTGQGSQQRTGFQGVTVIPAGVSLNAKNLI
jgi:transposase InsO family protein